MPPGATSREIMARTIGELLLEARGVLQDVVQQQAAGAFRYSDADMISYFNDALLQARSKRPDAFLDMGLRNAVPQYTTADTAVVFPIDMAYWSAFLFYIIGMCEIREDTFSDDSRAVTMLNKFVSQLLQVAS